MIPTGAQKTGNKINSGCEAVFSRNYSAVNNNCLQIAGKYCAWWYGISTSAGNKNYRYGK